MHEPELHKNNNNTNTCREQSSSLFNFAHHTIIYVLYVVMFIQTTNARAHNNISVDDLENIMRVPNEKRIQWTPIHAYEVQTHIRPSSQEHN